MKSVSEEISIVLDQTLFYPQGGKVHYDGQMLYYSISRHAFLIYAR